MSQVAAEVRREMPKESGEEAYALRDVRSEQCSYLEAVFPLVLCLLALLHHRMFLVSVANCKQVC